MLARSNNMNENVHNEENDKATEYTTHGNIF